MTGSPVNTPVSEAARYLAGQWQECGVAAGDLLLVHSSLSKTLLRLKRLGLSGTAEDVLSSFLLALGTEGTLLLPLFNFGFAKGQPFDIRATPSEMGILTEAGRTHPGAVRTGHPIYSFAVIGRQANRFAGLENFSGYGPDSPFAALREGDGKIAVLDLPDQHSMTYYHHVEEMERVPYRYHKTFRGAYTGLDGQTREREFGLFVRDLERGVLTAVGGMEEELWRRGLYQGHRPGSGCGLRVIRAQALHEATAEIIRAGRAEGMLFEYEKPSVGKP